MLRGRTMLLPSCSKLFQVALWNFLNSKIFKDVIKNYRNRGPIFGDLGEILSFFICKNARSNLEGAVKISVRPWNNSEITQSIVFSGASRFFQVVPGWSVEFSQIKNIQKCPKMSSKIIEIGDQFLMILDEILDIFDLEKCTERPGRTWTNLEGLGRS